MSFASDHSHSGHDHGHQHGDHGHGDGHDHAHHDHHLPWWRAYVFSTDHKVIGAQYALTAMVMMFIAFILMMLMRWTIAYPNQELPFGLSHLLRNNWVNSSGAISGSFYNMLGAMHGTMMVFLAIVPLGFGAFGNLVMPLQVGAPDMAFPKLNAASYWLYFIGAMMMVLSFFVPADGAANSGWTAYPPLAGMDDAGAPNPWMTGQTWWILAMVFLISSSLLGSVNVITTAINLRAKGLSWMRMPFFTWAIVITAFILLLSFPPLEAAAFMQLYDRVFHSSFFAPTGLVANLGEGPQQVDVAGSGSPILYQHLFWFLGHPEVYVLLLPALAIVAEVIPVNTRRPLWGYKGMVYALIVLAFMSFIVWAHHMYLTGMGTAVTSFFQTTTVLISIPSVILLTSLFISLWGGRVRFTLPMLWALAFLPMFGIGGLTGLPLAFSMTDIYLHDTYYVIGHFHYVVAPGILFGLFAGVYHWYPKLTGRFMSNFLGHLHFWPSLIGMNLIFTPMMIQGLHGYHRRWYDGGENYFLTTQDWLWLNPNMSWAVWVMAVFQFPFIINLFTAWKFGRKIASDNPWRATTLEWQTPTPPPHGNFTKEIEVFRGPYEYSVAGAEEDFCPQNQPLSPAEIEAAEHYDGFYSYHKPATGDSSGDARSQH